MAGHVSAITIIERGAVLTETDGQAWQ